MYPNKCNKDFTKIFCFPNTSKTNFILGFVVLDEENAETMRKTIFHLLQENERRQTLFEELASESTKLK